MTAASLDLASASQAEKEPRAGDVEEPLCPQYSKTAAALEVGTDTYSSLRGCTVSLDCPGCCFPPGMPAGGIPGRHELEKKGWKFSGISQHLLHTVSKLQSLFLQRRSIVISKAFSCLFFQAKVMCSTFNITPDNIKDYLGYF